MRFMEFLSLMLTEEALSGYTSFVDNITPSSGPGGIIISTTDGG